MSCPAKLHGINYNLFWFYMYLVGAELQRCSFAFLLIMFHLDVKMIHETKFIVYETLVIYLCAAALYLCDKQIKKSFLII